MTEPMPEPTDRRTFTPPPTKIRIGDCRWPGMTLQLGGIECVPRDAWDAAAGEIERLRSLLAGRPRAAVEVGITIADLPEVREALGGAAAEVERLRGLLGEALDGWAAAAEMGPHEPGRQRARDEIARIRREAGLT